MTDRSYYPQDISAILRPRWLEAGLNPADLPSDVALGKLIDAAYQASLLREEDDPVQCRVLVASAQDPELKSIEAAHGLYLVEFDNTCEFSAHQVRKMAGAVGYYRSLIGVQIDDHDDSAIIWGLIVTGAGWVNQTESSVYATAKLPSQLVIHILGPGHLVFAAGLTRVLETLGGRVLVDGFDPFRSKWLPKHFEPFRSALLSKLELTESEGASLRLPTEPASAGVKLCDSFVRDVAQSLVRRVLSLVRGRGRGGMLVYLNDVHDNRLDNWLRIRTRFKQAAAADRFQHLMIQLMKRAIEVGVANGIAEVRWRDFLAMHDETLGKLYDSLVEFSHFLADLMSVDGCLVLNRNFRLIGFGGEILGDSHVDSIERAIDLEAVQSVTEQADSSGTRHRSAYRLVSSVQDSIVVVVSQDGAVRFVAHQGGRLVYWPYLP